ncbi:hypothetical protein CQW23_26423 [Capsicum baccatum]|uniref:Protein kinase domain-containing protein n=1 Tax=Capsicum baccatum TaxID=33114 RepID=A0A2G2VNU8_CAPBA|nr:hypothetical protein CQW23_26423 [Capsicum baccatum]
MFVLAFVERLFRPTYKKDDIMLGKKLGEGSFGAAYIVCLARKPSSKASDKSCKDEGTGEGKEFKFATGVKPIPDICVVILNVLNEEGILIGDVTTGEALVLESSCVAKDAEEANRRGN